jgi:hypothetical protein
VRERSKKWAEDHAEHLREWRRKYNKDHTVARRDYSREWYRAHPQNTRARRFRKYYNLTVAEYDVMAEAQNFQCAICGRTKQLQVDHNHKTKAVRGLLCGRCNRGLGQFGDDYRLCQRAFCYLLKHTKGETCGLPFS